MKISTVKYSSTLTHYYAVILDYEDLLPQSKRFRLIVRDHVINVLICDTFFVSQELAREYFYRYYGKRSLGTDSSIVDEEGPNDVEWSPFTSFEIVSSRVIKAIISCLERLVDDSQKGKTASSIRSNLE